MSSSASSGAAALRPAERLEVLFEELAELAGQSNAIDGRIVEIVAEIDRDGLCGMTGPGRWPGWWPGSWACHRQPPKRSRPWPTGCRSFPAARQAWPKGGSR